MKRKRMFRLTAVFLAMVMCVTAFSVTALASGGEDTAEVTGGMEPDSSESTAAESDTEKNGDVEEPASDEEGADSDTEAADSDILEQITALLGGLGDVSADGDGNMTECTGPEPETEETAQPEETAEKEGGGAGMIVLVVLLLAAGGGAAFYFLVLKPKQKTKVPSDLDDLELEDEELEDEEYLKDDEDETEDTK